jgi:hypothetical protein
MLAEYATWFALGFGIKILEAIMWGEREREREGRREDRGLSYGDYVMKRVRKVDIYIKREMKQINNHTRKEMEKEKKVKACLASV